MHIKKMKPLSLRVRKKIYGFSFILPFIVGTILFFTYPMFRSVQISLYKIVNVTQFKVEWANFEFYRIAFQDDTKFIGLFIDSIKETLTFLPLINIFALIVAVMLNKKVPGRGLFRAFFFLPVMLGTGFVMQQVLGQNVDKAAMEVARGILLPEQIVRYIGPEITRFAQGFLGQITVIMWHSGVQIIVFLAGLQGIQISLYEASKVDGATEWQKFWLITLPMMVPYIMLNVVFTIVERSNDSSNPVIAYIKYMSVDVFNVSYEYVSAISILYMLFVLGLIIISFAIIRPFINRVKE